MKKYPILITILLLSFAACDDNESNLAPADPNSQPKILKITTEFTDVNEPVANSVSVYSNNFNADGHLISTTVVRTGGHPGFSGTENLNYTYNSDQQLIEVSSEDYSKSITYSEGRISKIVYDYHPLIPTTESFTYNNNGQLLTKEAAPSGIRSEYFYPGGNTLNPSKVIAGGVEVSYTYDNKPSIWYQLELYYGHSQQLSSNNPTAMTQGSPGSTPRTQTLSYEYAANGYPTKITIVNKGETSIYRIEYK